VRLDSFPKDEAAHKVPGMNRPTMLACVLFGIASAACCATLVPTWFADDPVGYTDTPMLPDGKWRVHDANRPVPPIVTPGERPQDLPSDTIVLFDGKDLSKWAADGGGDAQWVVKDGFAEVNGTGSIATREAFGDCQLHIEWASPEKVEGSSQGRGNSGVFFMGRYEVQILDSYENRTYADGQASALYGQTPPAVNASKKPGAWQTYDIVFEAPRFDGETLTRPARVTVFHNGVLVHHARELLGATAHKKVAGYAAHPAELPLGLQDHGNPIRFRNIWLRKL
jgi:hypothetical protein